MVAPPKRGRADISFGSRAVSSVETSEVQIKDGKCLDALINVNLGFLMCHIYWSEIGMIVG